MKTIALAFLLLLSGLLLAACSSIEAPASLTGQSTPAQEIAVQPTAPQTEAIGSSDWAAADFYAATCAGCHGVNGQGSSIAPPLTAPA